MPLPNEIYQPIVAAFIYYGAATDAAQLAISGL